MMQHLDLHLAPPVPNDDGLELEWAMPDTDIADKPQSRLKPARRPPPMLHSHSHPTSSTQKQPWPWSLWNNDNQSLTGFDLEGEASAHAGQAPRLRSGRLRNKESFSQVIIRLLLKSGNRHPRIFIVIFLVLFVWFLRWTSRPLDEEYPDTDPLPWRAYCSVPSISRPPNVLPGLQPSNRTVSDTLLDFPPANLDELPPAGIFIGVLTVDSKVERRNIIRETWARHERSRNGAGKGDRGAGTSRTIVRFILGQPKPQWAKQIEVEMKVYNDIIILPIQENMNHGKSYEFFSWASQDAWVPPNYSAHQQPHESSAPPPVLALHDPIPPHTMASLQWVRPDFLVKMDDDAFVMLAELESRLRVELHRPAHLWHPAAQRRSEPPLIYWGYMVHNQHRTFIAGELYALSWELVRWIGSNPELKTDENRIGSEDKLTTKWIRDLHPHADAVRWVSERCWVYDHPRALSVYAHGFLFPSEVNRIRQLFKLKWPRAEYGLKRKDYPNTEELSSPAATNVGLMDLVPSEWAASTTTIFDIPYQPPVRSLSLDHSIEALVEGSSMSKISPLGRVTPSLAWAQREGRASRYNGQRVGGTIVVHLIKDNSWYWETALAMLYGEESILPSV